MSRPGADTGYTRQSSLQSAFMSTNNSALPNNGKSINPFEANAPDHRTSISLDTRTSVSPTTGISSGTTAMATGAHANAGADSAKATISATEAGNTKALALQEVMGMQAAITDATAHAGADAGTVFPRGGGDTKLGIAAGAVAEMCVPGLGVAGLVGDAMREVGKYNEGKASGLSPEEILSRIRDSIRETVHAQQQNPEYAGVQTPEMKVVALMDKMGDDQALKTIMAVHPDGSNMEILGPHLRDLDVAEARAEEQVALAERTQDEAAFREGMTVTEERALDTSVSSGVSAEAALTVSEMVSFGALERGDSIPNNHVMTANEVLEELSRIREAQITPQLRPPENAQHYGHSNGLGAMAMSA